MKKRLPSVRAKLLSATLQSWAREEAVRMICPLSWKTPLGRFQFHTRDLAHTLLDLAVAVLVVISSAWDDTRWVKSVDWNWMKLMARKWSGISWGEVKDLVFKYSPLKRWVLSLVKIRPGTKRRKRRTPTKKRSKVAIIATHPKTHLIRSGTYV